MQVARENGWVPPKAEPLDCTADHIILSDLDKMSCGDSATPFLDSIYGAALYPEESSKPAIVKVEAPQLPPQNLNIQLGPKQLPHMPFFYPKNDAGRARWLLDRWGDRILYCSSMRSWLYYDGTKWVKDTKKQVEKLAFDTIRSGLAESVLESLSDKPIKGKRDAEKPSPREEWVAYVRYCENQRPIKNMMEAAERSVPVEQSDFDKEPLLLNCVNGVVDLKSGELIKHSPEQRFLKVCKVSYDPTKKCPMFEAFLTKIFDGDEGVIKYIRSLFGYFCSGSVTERVLPIFYGSGANGKGVLINVIRRVLGGDFVTPCPTSPS